MVNGRTEAEDMEREYQRQSLRDHFAAAALTGFIRGMPSDSIFHLGLLARQSYEVADAMLRERGDHSEKPNSSTNHDAAPAARADSRPPGNSVASAVTGTGKQPAPPCVETDRHPCDMQSPAAPAGSGEDERRDVPHPDTKGPAAGGPAHHLSDRSQPVKDDVSDRSKPINDDRLSALEELSALDQELEERHGLQGNPMIKAHRNNESI